MHDMSRLVVNLSSSEFGLNLSYTFISPSFYGRVYTLLAKKLCDSSFLGQNLDLINYHFKTDRVMSFIF